MKANELRLGNIVEQGEIKGLDYLGFAHIKGDKWLISETKDVKPIPLTEEWLLKFGFIHTENIQGLKHYWLDDTGLFAIRESKYNNKAYDLIVHVRVAETVFIMSFDYVHEIQNYFALTGEELTISE